MTNYMHSASGPSEPVSGASVWCGSDFKKRDGWEHYVTDRHIQEINDAIKAVRQSGLTIPEIGAKNFNLPSLGSVLARIRDEVVNGSGIAMLRGLPVNQWSREESAIAYWGIGTHVGQAVSQNQLGHVLGHVKDLGEDAKDVKTRGYRSHAALPYHTDLGAEIVALLCLKSAKSGGLSSITSAAAIHNEMLKSHSGLVAELAGDWHFDRRGEELPGMKPYFTMPVFSYCDDRLFVCYIKPFIETAQRFEGVPPLTERQKEALQMVRDLAESPKLRLDIGFEPGDVQFVNNMTTLHSRTEYEDYDEPAEKRHLLRLWLSVPDGPKLPGAFYERYGVSSSSTRPMGVNPPDGVLIAPLEAA